MGLQQRLTKLERSLAPVDDRCTHCPDTELICRYRQDGFDGNPVPIGKTLPGACLACDRPAVVVELVEVVVRSREEARAMMRIMNC